MKLQQGWLTRKSGSWIGHYSKWIETLTGTKKRVQKAFVIGAVEEFTKPEARLILRNRIDEDLNPADVKPSGRVTLAWFIENRWKPLREGTWRGNTPTANKYFFSHIINRFGSRRLDTIDAVELQVFLNELAKDYSGSVVRHVRMYLKSFFVEAVEQDFVRKSPARLLRMPYIKPVPKPFLKQEEIQRLLNVATGRERVLLRTIFATGLRPSELFALRWRCFDPEKKLLRITESVYRCKVRPFTKTTDETSDNRLQQVFLPDTIVKDLQEWRQGAAEGEFIFPNEQGKPLNRENYRTRYLVPLARKAGIPKLTFQILRRSVATHMQSLASPQDIAGVLRHTRPQTAAEHYVQIVPESVRQAGERLAAAILQ